MGDSGFPSRKGKGSIAEERQVEMYEPDPAGLCHCTDEGMKEVVKITFPGPEGTEADACV